MLWSFLIDSAKQHIQIVTHRSWKPPVIFATMDIKKPMIRSFFNSNLSIAMSLIFLGYFPLARSPSPPPLSLSPSLSPSLPCSLENINFSACSVSALLITTQINTGICLYFIKYFPISVQIEIMQHCRR